ncbi:hypothetical protein LCGC14_2183730 [marine sediment metagenome]|uniref:Uncharacterized protein n=1 Tax=marine sediment metagenome TaxID=412755 RepID=A0A0F9E8K7_9ZZZZ
MRDIVLSFVIGGVAASLLTGGTWLTLNGGDNSYSWDYAPKHLDTGDFQWSVHFNRKGLDNCFSVFFHCYVGDPVLGAPILVLLELEAVQLEQVIPGKPHLVPLGEKDKSLLPRHRGNDTPDN